MSCGFRIIPARAGFTAHSASAWPATADHPRSRGVYGEFVVPSGVSDGSSPLARGLPPFSIAFLIAIRDHPRSRGVYRHSLPTEGRGGGSSPLARGLHSALVLRRALGGIIPARAGFTDRFDAGSGYDRDHPRSRGVYSPAYTARPEKPGSSPLARGLPRHSRSRHRYRRIIPARAGFTSAPSATGKPERDHPRSRGVYRLYWSPVQVPTGSSPLARGLRRAPRVPERWRRIIPARAGFTPSASHSPSPPADHPRSRGVYSESYGVGPAISGSSPLARGLPPPTGVVQASSRIIPARAGFTGIMFGITN